MRTCAEVAKIEFANQTLDHKLKRTASIEAVLFCPENAGESAAITSCLAAYLFINVESAGKSAVSAAHIAAFFEEYY